MRLRREGPQAPARAVGCEQDGLRPSPPVFLLCNEPPLGAGIAYRYAQNRQTLFQQTGDALEKTCGKEC